MAEISFSEMTSKDFEAIPVPQRAIKSDPYAVLITALSEGKALSIPYNGETDLKGKRITIARKARSAGFMVDFRVHNGTLAVKKSDSPIPPKREVVHRTKKD